MRTTAAAERLGVSPSTLRAWEQRHGFPRPRRSEGGHRQFDAEDVEALAVALSQTGDVRAAIVLARERGGPGLATHDQLRAALGAFDAEAADRLAEASLAVRSVERTVTELVLPAAELPAGSPERGFAERWATGWLLAQTRLAPPASRPDGVLVFGDGLPVAALELALRRRGVRVLVLAPDVDPGRLGRAVGALRPGAVVLAGAHPSLDALGRLVFAVRQAGAGDAAVVDFRGAVPDTGASTVGRLPGCPAEAAAELVRRLDAPVMRRAVS